jgi:signal transduction histidine kinase
MIDALADPKWHRLLSLSVHEFRTPITVVAGYIRMLLKDRAGPLSDQQRRLLEEAEKSCGRLSSLVAEMSELSSLEAGSSPFNRSNIDIDVFLREAIAALPQLPDREIGVELSGPDQSATVQGDPGRLRTAFTSLLTALRRELVTSNRLHVRHVTRQHEGRTVAWIAIGDDEQIERLTTAEPSALATFDEWRGGCGLSLAIARRVFAAHHGSVWSAGEDAKAGAVVMLPHGGSN